MTFFVVFIDSLLEDFTDHLRLLPFTLRRL